MTAPNPITAIVVKPKAESTPPRSVVIPPHPADGMTISVDCGDGAVMEIADPRSYGGLCDAEQGIVWTLTWGDCASVRYTAASLLSSYDYLLCSDITMAEATRRLRLLRSVRRAALRATKEAE